MSSTVRQLPEISHRLRPLMPTPFGFAEDAIAELLAPLHMATDIGYLTELDGEREIVAIVPLRITRDIGVFNGFELV